MVFRHLVVLTIYNQDNIFLLADIIRTVRTSRTFVNSVAYASNKQSLCFFLGGGGFRSILTSFELFNFRSFQLWNLSTLECLKLGTLQLSNFRAFQLWNFVIL